jgi:hypothetical protein
MSQKKREVEISQREEKLKNLSTGDWGRETEKKTENAS